MDDIQDDAQPCRDAESISETELENVSPDNASTSLAEELEGYFGTLSKPHNRKRFSDNDIHRISEILKALNPKWSKFPRLYIILKAIDHLDDLDTFIAQGVTDIWFPFTVPSFPSTISQSTRMQFLGKQWIVLTKAMDLEKGDQGAHCYFGQDETLPFVSKGKLGTGNFGEVDKVLSLWSHEEFARKRIRRGNVFRHARKSMEDVEKEVAALKRVKHHHIVELVGSYTDPAYVGLIFSPVADSNLAEFLSAPDSSSKKGLLRSFFSCLAAGLVAMHKSSIRHKDIKPANILIKGNVILYADFGLAHHWEDLGHSTTQHTSPVMTRMYSAPELLNGKSRNSSADIWSLGCVFLEMITVLKDKTVADVRSFLENFGTQSIIYALNRDGILTWIDKIGIRSNSDPDMMPLDCARQMLRERSVFRPTAEQLLAMLERFGTPNDHSAEFGCLPCQREGNSIKTTISSSSDETGKANNETVPPFLQTPDPPKVDEPAISQAILANSKPSIVSLFSAIRKGDVARAKHIIEGGVDVESADFFGRKALYKAVEIENLEVLNMLIEKGARLDVGDNEGDLPFHLAIRQGSDRLVKLFLEKGADINLAGKFKLRALHVATLMKQSSCTRILINAGADLNSLGSSNVTPLYLAAYSGDEESARFLLEANADPETKETDQGRTAAHISAFFGHTEILAILLNNGAAIDCTDNSLETPLLLSIWRDHLACTKLLLQRGADPFHFNVHGSNAMHSAARNGHVEHIKALVNWGVSVDIPDPKGNTPLKLASIDGRFEIVQLLLNLGAAVDSPSNQGVTALMEASWRGNQKLVDLLIQNAANVNSRDVGGVAALHLAVWIGSAEVAEVLLAHSAEVDSRDNTSETPLHYAAKKGKTSIAEVLLAHGAELNSKSSAGAIPLDLAISEGHEEVAELLIQAQFSRTTLNE